MTAVPRQSGTIHFLIAYDHDTRQRIRMERLSDGARAVVAYGEMEREYEHNPRVEVVLLGADSEEAIRVTHPNYFDDQPLDELLDLVR